jgi:hypothetical protein
LRFTLAVVLVRKVQAVNRSVIQVNQAVTQGLGYEGDGDFSWSKLVIGRRHGAARGLIKPSAKCPLLAARWIAKISEHVNVFIKCPKCGHQNRMDGITALRADLAMFRGSEDPVRCKQCQADMDTMTAYCGEQVGSEITRREDPRF